VHQAFKVACALNLEDMSQVLERAIYEYIANDKKTDEMEKAFEDWLKGFGKDDETENVD
jgi:hypothetical protein